MHDDGVWIHQDAWFHMGNFDAGTTKEYSIKKEGNGLYAFILKGNVTINDQELNTRDAIGITDFKTVISAICKISCCSKIDFR